MQLLLSSPVLAITLQGNTKCILQIRKRYREVMQLLQGGTGDAWGGWASNLVVSVAEAHAPSRPVSLRPSCTGGSLGIS